MNRKFIYTDSFRRCWKSMGLNDDDLFAVENELLKNPQSGDVIEGTGGARKIRVQLNKHGKRGGGRVIYVDVFIQKCLCFLFAYPKSAQPDLTAKQKRIITEMVKTIQKEQL